MTVAVVLVIVGLVVLAKAADQFVTGAARIALGLQISPVVVGVVIVGFGTSAPELLVSGIAAGEGDTDLGVGNVVGSNVANLSLVLGISALIVPISVTRATLRREGVLSVLAVCFFVVMIQDGLSRWRGAVLFVALVLTLGYLVRSSLREAPPLQGALATTDVSLGREAVRTVIGLGLTVAGAQALVTGAIDLAERIGLGTGFVGLTLVAIGTSLPELVTGVAAARQAESGLLIGNLLGSNIFNSLAVGGLVSVIGPGPLEDPKLAGLASFIMIGVAVLGLAFMATGLRVIRWEAAALLAVYLATLPFLVTEDDDDGDTEAVAAVVVMEPAGDPHR